MKVLLLAGILFVLQCGYIYGEQFEYPSPSEFEEEIKVDNIDEPETDEVSFNDNVEILPKENQKTKSIQCMICKGVLNFILRKYGPRPNEQQVRNALGKVCKIFGGFLKRVCNGFVNRYGNKIVELMRNQQGTLVCSIIQICSTNKDQSPYYPPKPFYYQQE